MRGFGGLLKGSAVFHGTSITLAVRSGVTAQQALPALVGPARGFSPWRNAGVSGNTSAQMLARFESDVLAYGPTMVAIEGGTNDPSNGISVGSVGSAGTYADNMAQMIVKAQRTGARVTVWVPNFAIDTTTDTAIAPYRTAARSLASTYGCDLFDTHDDTVALGSTIYNTYYVTGETPNGIHWNGAGCAWGASLVGSGAYLNSFRGA